MPAQIRRVMLLLNWFTVHVHITVQMLIELLVRLWILLKNINTPDRSSPKKKKHGKKFVSVAATLDQRCDFGP